MLNPDPSVWFNFIACQGVHGSWAGAWGQGRAPDEGRGVWQHVGVGVVLCACSADGTLTAHCKHAPPGRPTSRACSADGALIASPRPLVALFLRSPQSACRAEQRGRVRGQGRAGQGCPEAVCRFQHGPRPPARVGRAQRLARHPVRIDVCAQPSIPARPLPRILLTRWHAPLACWLPAASRARSCSTARSSASATGRGTRARTGTRSATLSSRSAPPTPARPLRSPPPAADPPSQGLHPFLYIEDVMRLGRGQGQGQG